MATFTSRAVITCLILALANCHGYKYLLLHPFYSGSHVLTLHTVTQELIQKGHEVTTIRFADPNGLSLKPMGKNHKEIVLHLNNTEGNLPFTSKGEKGTFMMPMKLLWSRGLALSTIFDVIVKEGSPWTVVKSYCHQLLSDKALIETLRVDNYDVAIVDVIYNECGLALARHLNLPSVAYWAFSFAGGEADCTTAALPPSHIPTFLSMLTQEMSFFERIQNAGKKLFSLALMEFHTYVCDGVISQHLPDAPPSKQLLADLNGALINSDTILDYPRLQPETFLNIGGMQIARKQKPLPGVIKDFIDGAKDGVVIFTMGFIFNPAFVPKERVDSLLQAFARLPQRVIVKFDSNIRDVPENVLVLPFLPQQDILAHSKTKVFITHCGMHGVMEAIYHRVPMVGMPVFIDQGDVGVRMTEKGIGKVIDKFATSDELYEAIVEVRDNPIYKSNIDKLSELMKKRRNHPMDDAVWLLEFLADTKGAEHLQLSSRHLNFVQYFCLDIALLFVGLLFLLAKSFRLALGSRNTKKRKTD